MCSAIFLRITLIASTRSPTCGFGGGGAAISGAGPGGVGSVGRGGAAAGVPDSMKLRMSFLVTRPLMPVPSSLEISTPCSWAILRTSGLDLVRRRSSEVGSGLVSTGAGAGGGGGGGSGAGGGGSGGGGSDTDDADGGADED